MYVGGDGEGPFLEAVVWDGRGAGAIEAVGAERALEVHHIGGRACVDPDVVERKDPGKVLRGFVD